jgi:hypothetical protein
MEAYDIYLEFVDFKKFGRMSSLSLDDACDISSRYENEECRRREGIRSCWVTKAHNSAIVLGAAPKNWSPNIPVYENTW